MLGISNLALYASLTSALLLDILSVVFVLLPFSDNGLVAALKILGEVGDPLLVQHLYAQLLFMAVLFAFMPISLYKRKTVVWQALQSWNLVGIALQIAAIPYIRGGLLFSIVSRIAIALCIKVIIADLSFVQQAVEQRLTVPN